MQRGRPVGRAPRRPRGTLRDPDLVDWRLSTGVVLLLLAVSLAVYSWSLGRDEASASAGPVAEGCAVTPERPGPLVDLAVEPATGDPAAPYLAPATVVELVRAAADAGADVISTTAAWDVVQPHRADQYDFRGLDLVLDAAADARLEVRVLLARTPAWAVDDPAGGAWTPPRTSAELARWARYAGDVAAHLDGRAAYVEVWPEPDRAATWRTGPDPAAFARLLEATYPAVTAADPDVEVVSGGLAANDLGYVDELYDALALRDPDGAARPFDLLGLHPFSPGPPSVDDPALRSTAGELGPVDENFVGYTRVHALMAERGDGDVPLYLGAFGYGATSASDPQRATYVAEALDATTCTPYVRALSWWHLHPTPQVPSTWTLLDPAQRRSATYEALRAWTLDRAATLAGS